MPMATAWSLIGGADAPSPLFTSGASTFNLLQLHSTDDTIEGVATGIFATGGRRFRALTGTVSSNSVEMTLLGTAVVSTTADLTLSGTTSLVGGVHNERAATAVAVMQTA